jgi:hypothetical protein
MEWLLSEDRAQSAVCRMARFRLSALAYFIFAGAAWNFTAGWLSDQANTVDDRWLAVVLQWYR